MDVGLVGKRSNDDLGAAEWGGSDDIGAAVLREE